MENVDITKEELKRINVMWHQFKLNDSQYAVLCDNIINGEDDEFEDNLSEFEKSTIGRWIRLNPPISDDIATYRYRCNHCGEDVEYQSRYCPSCGDRKYGQ